MFLSPKSRCGVGKNKLRKLIEVAKESIGSTVGLTAAKMEIVSLLKDFEGKNIEIEELDNIIIEMCKSLIEQSSGKHKGETTISKRGRSGLRKTLYMAIVSMLRHNDGFKQLYSYYTKRPKNQLKGKQAIIALIRKLLRIIHALIVKDVSYNENKMLLNIIHPKEFRLVS